MVDVVEQGFLSDLRPQKSYRRFPDDDRVAIRAAVEAVPDEVFESGERGVEIRRVDALVAAELPDYEHEHAGERGRNPACKLWTDAGFDHSVDLYDPESRIAIEVEKSERKRISDDILKFVRGGKTQRDGRKTVEFGCLVVPTNYRGSGDLFAAAMTTLDFVRPVLFVEDVLVLGYRDPRWA